MKANQQRRKSPVLIPFFRQSKNGAANGNGASTNGASRAAHKRFAREVILRIIERVKRI